jgi:Uma2 family endonuclease
MFTPVIEIPAETPRSIVLEPPLSDDEFERLCEKSDFAFLERTKEGAIIVNAPAGGSTSSGNAEITRQLSNWWIQSRRGRVFDSSAGFFLPDGSVLSPDASHVTAEQLKGLTRNDLARFLRLAPAFVIELRSESDRLAALAEKMNAWMANGVELGWLVDPYAREVHIYESGAASPRIEKGTQVAGSGPVAGFVLDLEEIWRCYE